MIRLRRLLSAQMIVGLVIASSAEGGARGGVPPNISARPNFIRVFGFLVALDEGNDEIVIRDYRTVRRTFKVGSQARHALSTLSPGDAVIVTCRPSEKGQTVVRIELASI